MKRGSGEDDRAGKGTSPSVRVVERATSILFALAEKKTPMGPTEIGRMVDLDRATVHRLLQTLAARDMVVQAKGTGRYVLGPGLLRLSEGAPGSELRHMAAPYIRKLRDHSNETVALGVSMQNRCVQILQEASPLSIHWNAATGESAPLYAGATGRAMLAFLNPRNRAAAMAEPYPAAAAGLVDTLRREAERDIATIRRRGFATATQETAAVDVKGLAAPIFDRTGKPVAAITIGWPASRYSDAAMNDCATQVLEAVNELSSRLGYNVKRVVRRSGSPHDGQGA